MNEDIQKEILEILRALREGSSPAFQMLVDHRCTAAMVKMIANGFAFIIPLILLLYSILKKYEVNVSHSQDRRVGFIKALEYMPEYESMSRCFVILVCLIGTVIFSVNFIEYFSIYMAPLSHVLNLTR